MRTSWPTFAAFLLIPFTLAAESKPTACPYKVAHDAPLDAKEAVVTEAGDHTHYRVEFNGINGDRVPGFLYVPKKEKSKRPVVLLQYGSGGDKKVDYIVKIGQQFVDHGFVVLTIDSPLRGERKPKEKKPTPSPGSEEGRDVFLQYLGDYSRAVDYLLTRPEVDKERIGYLGISYGAITGIPFVAHDPRVKAMASLVGGGDFASRFPGSPSDKVKEIMKQTDPCNHIGIIAPRPLLLLNATKDQLIPKACAEALHKAAGKGSKIVWHEMDHYFTGVDKAKVTEDVIKFLEENLPAK